jgi:hypothetical protein
MKEVVEFVFLAFVATIFIGLITQIFIWIYKELKDL